MYPYKFQLDTTTTLTSARNILQSLGDDFIIQMNDDKTLFTAEKQQTSPKQSGYIVPIQIEGQLVTLDAGRSSFHCKAKLTSNALFRQLIISIFLVSFIAMTWRASGTAILVAKWVAALVIVGSFMSAYKALTSTASLFKSALKKQLSN